MGNPPYLVYIVILLMLYYRAVVGKKLMVKHKILPSIGWIEYFPEILLRFDVISNIWVVGDMMATSPAIG